MKYIKQLVIILIVTVIAEFFETMIPIPIPASIYGIILMFTLLNFKIIKLEDIENVGVFLIEVMAIMFIPAAVGIIENVEELINILVPFIFVVSVSTIIIIGATGKTIEFILNRRENKKI